MIRRLCALLTLTVFVPACAAATKQQAVYKMALVSESYAVALQRLQAWEISQNRSGLINLADHIVWQKRIEKLALAGKAANDALRAAQLPGVQQQARAIVAILDELIDEQVIRFSDQQRMSAMLLMEAVRTAVLIWSASLSAHDIGSPVLLQQIAVEAA